MTDEDTTASARKKEELFSTQASLFHYSNGSSQFKSAGSVTVSVVCYDDGSLLQLICTDADTGNSRCCARIGRGNNSSLKFVVQSESYASFRCDGGEQYSLYFKSVDPLILLSLTVGLAVSIASDSPQHSTTVLDVTQGKGDAVDVNDAIAVKYSAHFVQGRQLHGLYDGNFDAKRTYKFPVPSSNSNLESGMKGFEGTVAGMRTGSRRVVVIPPACKNAAGDSTIVAFMEVTKVKVDSGRKTVPNLPTVASFSMNTTNSDGFDDDDAKDTGKLQDALLAKEARIRDLELQVTKLKVRADNFAGQQLEANQDKKHEMLNRAETDRLIVKLEEQVNHQLGSMDNFHATLRLNEAKLKKAELEKQEAKGQMIVHKVAAEGLKMKVHDLTDLLNTERTARDRAEERAEKNSKELEHFKESLFQKTQALNELIRKAENDKQSFLRTLDEERQRAEDFIDKMKDDMMGELARRHDTAVQERNAMANESFTKGVDHGRDVANSESRMRWESQIRDLNIENTRLKALVDSQKAELTIEKQTNKSTIERLCYPEEAQRKEVEVLQAHVQTMQEELSRAFDKVAQQESDLAGATARVLHAEQHVRDTEVKCKSAVVALSRQAVPKHQLLALLQS
eukprot:gene2900-4554_t